MKRITITLEDDDLRSAIESEAQIAGSTEQDVIIQALQFWLAETELDCEERRELEAARREFFDSLRAAESARDGDSAAGCDGV